MATLNVTEFSRTFHQDGSARLVYYEMPYEPAILTEIVTFTTATQGSIFNSKTDFIRVVASADCYILFGSNPTATTSHEILKADVEYFRGIATGEKLSVVAA